MCVIEILCNLNYSNYFQMAERALYNALPEHIVALCGRIKGTARSIISVLRTVGIYSTGGEFIAQWAETDLRSTSRKSCLKHRQLVQYGNYCARGVGLDGDTAPLTQ